MQCVVVDIPENVLFGLLKLESPELPNEVFPDFVNEAIGNCLTVINRVRLLLHEKRLDAETYFKAKLYASQIDSKNPFRDDRCEMLVHFSGELRQGLAEWSRNEYRNPRSIHINNTEHLWVEDLLRVFSDAIAGKTVYGFSESDRLAVNMERNRIGLVAI